MEPSNSHQLSFYFILSECVLIKLKRKFRIKYNEVKKLLKTDMITDGRKYIVIILRGIFM